MLMIQWPMKPTIQTKGKIKLEQWKSPLNGRNFFETSFYGFFGYF